MNSDLFPGAWSNLYKARKPSLYSAVVFGINAIVGLLLAYATSQLLFLFLFVASFIVGALELQKWLRCKQSNYRLSPRQYSNGDYQALGISLPQKKYSKLQKAFGLFASIVIWILTTARLNTVMLNSVIGI